MATNNNAHTLDSAGNPQVDFVWGPFPLQPNDQRTENVLANYGGTTGSSQISYRTAVVTAASADGTTVTYTAANSFNVGQNVTITGLSTSAFNLTDVKIASLVGSAGAYTGFTVTNSATGTGVTGATAVAKVVETLIPGVGADTAWSATTYGTPTRLEFGGISAYSGSNVIPNKTISSRNHELDETAYGGYPAFTPAVAKYMVTQVEGDGTTVTYQCQNFYAGGETVTITGCGSFNLTGVTIAKATRDYFTVTNSTTGSLININNGVVSLTSGASASDGAYIAGVAYIDVPSVLGLTTALAVDSLKDSGYTAANVTTAAGATNTATQPTRVNVTATDTATVTVSGGTSTWPVGTKVTIAAGTGIPTAVVGTWTVTGGSGTTLVISGSGWTVADSGAITPGTVLTGAAGTIKTQNVAAGAASIALGTTITVTPWA